MATGKDTNVLWVGPEPEEERDRVLGAYMSMIGTVEGYVGLMVRGYLKADFGAAEAVLSTISNAQIHDLMSALARLRLNEEDFASFSSVLRRFHKVNTKRNRIVHGHWITTQSREGDTITSKWVRRYLPLNPDLFEEAFRGSDAPAVSETFTFTLKQVEAARGHAEALAYDLRAWYRGSRRMLGLRPPERGA